MLEVTEAETAYGEQQGIYVLYQKRYKFFLLSLKDFFYCKQTHLQLRRKSRLWFCAEMLMFDKKDNIFNTYIIFLSL